MTQQDHDEVQTNSEAEEQFVVMLRKLPPAMRAEIASDLVSISLAAMCAEETALPV